jgi:hypothetical protein
MLKLPLPCAVAQVIEVVVSHGIGGRFDYVMTAGGAPLLVNTGNFASALSLRVEYMTHINSGNDFSKRHPLGGASRFCSDPNSHDVSLARLQIARLLFGTNNSIIHGLLTFGAYGKR